MEEDDYQQKDNGVMMCKMLMDFIPYEVLTRIYPIYTTIFP